MGIESGEMKEFNIAICVPFHKCELSNFEKISLQQLVSVLGKYEIIVFLPESLNTELFDEYKIRFEYFKDEYFTSQKSYSRLLLEKAFYKRFELYDYILIYQLDCFVFSDKLMDFCRMGYDYIGAPGIVIAPYLGTLFKRKKYFHWENGGLSLRKVKSFIRVLDNIGDINGLTYEEYLYDCEDFLYSYFASYDKYGFTMAPIEAANTFSVEFNLDNSFQRIKSGNLPFGTHAWQKMNYDMWKPLIEAYGYNLPEIDDVNFIDTSDYSDIQWKIYYICREVSEGRIDPNGIEFLKKIKNNVSIYGYGKYGKTIQWMLEVLGVTLNYIFDMREIGKNKDKWINPCFMNKNTLATTIIVSVIFETNEIENNLKLAGYKRNIDYFLIRDFLDRIYREIK